MKNAFLSPMLAALSLLAVATAAHANLLTNGDFELPAVSGNGDVSSTQGLSLPGWTFSLAGNSFFLEHGTPFGVSRFEGGRQAVLLNFDGNTSLTPLSQTFATVAGDAYRVNFGMNEEHVDHSNSLTSLRVDVAGVSTTFVLDQTAGGKAGPNGYVDFSFAFTAAGADTTLSFTDVTSGSFPIDSPFLDNISVDLVSDGGGEGVGGVCRSRPVSACSVWVWPRSRDRAAATEPSPKDLGLFDTESEKVQRAALARWDSRLRCVEHRKARGRGSSRSRIPGVSPHSRQAA